MRSIAAKLKKRFYGYRSACITALVNCFSKTNIFNTHHSARITETFYLDLQNLDLIDSIFTLPCVD